jgi:hypothetical protein
MARSQENPKLKGPLLCTFEGLDIYGSLHKAKRNGKDRIWIQIRQKSPKKYRVNASLSYARSIDVQFVEDEEK